MLKYYISLGIAILIGVGGQVSLKAGSINANYSNGFALFDPYIIFGLACYFVSALFYLYALRQIPVSVAFPSVSLSYVGVSLFAHILWNEPFGLQQCMALVLIFTGVFFLVKI